MKTIIFCTIILLSQSLLFGQSQINPDSLEAKMYELLNSHSIPGMAVGIVSSEGILNLSCAGTRKLGIEDPIQIHDRFHLGSNTKAMTAFVAAALVEKGNIQWDTKFFDLFPEMEEESLPVYQEITLEDLLRHQAFIQPYTEEEEWKLVPKETGENIILQRQKWCKQLLQLPPVELDSIDRFTYSNAGYVLATAMLEKVSGIEYETLMEKHLFEPLDIQGAFSWPSLISPAQPWGHTLDEKDSVLIALGPDHEYKIGRLLSPAGDVNMSPAEYCRFLQVHLNGIHGRSDVLKAETYSKLHEINEDHPIYALGWGVGDASLKGETFRLSTHDGSAGTFHFHAMILHDFDLAFCIMLNAAEEEHETATNQLKKWIAKNLLANLPKEAN